MLNDVDDSENSLPQSKGLSGNAQARGTRPRSMILLALVFLILNFGPGLASASNNVPGHKIATNIVECEKALAQLMKERGKHTGDVDDYLARRKTIEETLPGYAKDVKSIFYHFDRPGLKFSVEQGPYTHLGSNDVELKSFTLDYDPSKFSRFSIVRQTFGEAPLHYSAHDVRHLGQTLLLGEEGDMLEIYLNGRRGPGTDGGLIMISRDTGQLRFYPPGTDVDAAGEGVLKGSATALWHMAKGLAGEAQCAICKYKGDWYTDKHVIDVIEVSKSENGAPQLDPPKTLSAVERAITDLPELKNYVTAFLNDPALPPPLRNKLVTALKQPGITVSALTQIVRTEHNITRPLLAVAVLDDGNIITEEHPALKNTLNQQLDDSLTHVPPSSVFLYPVVMDYQMVNLVHEIAHVRFQAFLEKNKTRLAEIYSDPETIRKVRAWSETAPHPIIQGASVKLPASEMDKPLMRMQNGKLIIARHFYEYLHEVYTLDAEMQIKSSSKFVSDFGPDRYFVKPENRGIATVQTYRFSDPRVIGLAGVPLRQLLTGKLDYPPGEVSADIAAIKNHSPSEWTAISNEFREEQRRAPSWQEIDKLTNNQLRTRSESAARQIKRLDELLIDYEKKWENLSEARDGFFAGVAVRRASGEVVSIQASAREQIAWEKLHPVDEIKDAIEEAKSAKYYYQQEIKAYERARLRNNDSLPKSPLPVFRIERTFSEEEHHSSEQIYRQIVKATNDAGLSTGDVYIRFIIPQREDLVRLHGTDRVGLNNNDSRKFAWDTNTLAPALMAKGLTLEDGLYLLNLEQRPPNGFLEDFAAGRLSLVVYDKTKIEPLEWDYAAFKHPASKTDAVLGLMRMKK